MGRLDGKVAVVTGASSGIGEATAYALANEGATIAIGARREEKLHKVADRIRDNGGSVMAQKLDVTSNAEVTAFFKAAGSLNGGVDILVNNAGLMLLGPMSERPVEEWRTMMEVNVMGALYCIKAVLPVMVTRGSGYIVNISSTSGRRTTATGAVYSGTKFALNAITEGLRKEVHDRGVRVVAIEPGLVDTELPHHVQDENIRDRLLNMDGFTKLQSEDIAEAVLYAVTQPSHVNVNEILIRPTDQKN